MPLELTSGKSSRKSRVGGDAEGFPRSPSGSIADADSRRETAGTRSGNFLGSVQHGPFQGSVVQNGNEAVERGEGERFFDPLRSLAAERHSGHSVDSVTSGDGLLADSGGYGGISTIGRVSTDAGGGAGGHPMRTLVQKQHSRHSVDSVTSCDGLLAESGGCGGTPANGMSSTEGRQSTDSGRCIDSGGGVAAISHSEMVQGRKRREEGVGGEDGEAGRLMPLGRPDNYTDGERVFFLKVRVGARGWGRLS